MTEATTTQTTQTKMLTEHRTLVATYPVKTGADKAQVSKKINLLESDMIGAGLRMRVESADSDSDYMVVTIDGVQTDSDKYDFDHFVIPTPYSKKWTFTESELLGKVESLRKQATAEYLPDIMRSGADRQLIDRLREADKRGIKVPEGYVPTAE
jgi:hypothetical protein